MLESFEYPGLNPEQLGQFTQFAQLLQEANQQINLTRITRTWEIYQRHFCDSLTLLAYLDGMSGGRFLADVGSGPGFPGLALAIARPDWQVDSVEATGKKVRFQQSVIDALALTQVRAVQGRAEELGREDAWRGRYAVVTARAVARLAVLAELCLPLVRVEGLFLAMKGPDVQEELDHARSALAILGGQLEKVVPYDLEGEQRFHLVVVRKVQQTPEAYPRLYQAIQKQSL